MTDGRPIETLLGSFAALADEVQSLIDRKTILEHKLRYAHEQYQLLADKYAPAAPEVSETLAALQLAPDLKSPITTPNSAIPLPRRCQPGGTQHQIALLIREGRKAVQQLTAHLASPDHRDASGMETEPMSRNSSPTRTPAMLEQDFTVQGKKSALDCPFSGKSNPPAHHHGGDGVDASPPPLTGSEADPTPHKSSDPICAAMLDDSSAAAAAVTSKCPIRYLDKHSPEEIAHYVETHKHEIPRSHELCVRRYQRNEEQIRKLDAKYGSLVGMIKDLSQLHRPMLPTSEEEQAAEDAASNKRVETWAQTVTAGDPPQGIEESVEEERENHFDRPLRDVRLGESPSRPWGIQIPPAAEEAARARLADLSSPPARIQPDPMADHPTTHPGLADARATSGTKKCPFGHSQMLSPDNSKQDVGAGARVPTPKAALPNPSPQQPTFVNLPELSQDTKGQQPQVVFNISGPVFIGYPMEQAIQFMQRFQAQ